MILSNFQPYNLVTPKSSSLTRVNPSFGTNSRVYSNPRTGDEMGCNTWLFRNDVDWKKLAKYELNHFKDKDKVNIVMFASSDGSEAYTKIMSLIEATKPDEEEAQKFFSIKAFDLDEEIVSAAKSGFVNTCLADRLQLQMNTDDYFDYFTTAADDLDIKDDSSIQKKKTLKAKNVLTRNVSFNRGDMFEELSKLKDNSDTVLMCRNVLGYFEDEKIEQFVKLASNKLKSGSLFVVGEHDSKMFDMSKCMTDNGFEQVIQNVYKKT